ncbi:COG0313 Predicted methyltransferases [Oxalobacteraceae bacterium]
MSTPSSSLLTSLVQLTSDLEQQRFPESALYVVATPIGNIADVSLRALKVLSLVDAIACEDTRNTGLLMSRLGLSTPLFSAHQHNERESAEKIIGRLRKGERIALVSDAGTPAISDPGTRIVDAVIDAGLSVIPIAGACAGIAALSASGLMTDEFYFVGFLPSKTSQRAQLLSRLTSTRATLIFYEAPHRILESAQALANALDGTRRVVVAREISKLFEQIHRCQLSELHDWLAQAPEHQKGEFVLLVEAAVVSDEPDLSEAARVLTILLESNSVSQAAALAARITGLKKNALYDLALKMQTNDE